MKHVLDMPVAGIKNATNVDTLSKVREAIQVQEETGAESITDIGEAINVNDAIGMTGAFCEVYPDMPAGYIIGRGVLDAILTQPGCHGVKFYNALHEGIPTLVYAAVDAQGALTGAHAILDKDELKSTKPIVADRAKPGPYIFEEDAEVWGLPE